MKKTVGLSLSMLLIVLTFACKKIEKNAFDMSGAWYSEDGYCDTYIEIKENGLGAYGSLDGDKGCGYGPWNGKARYDGTHLYIGITKFKWLSKPEILSGLDSVIPHGAWKWGTISQKYPRLAKMKIKQSFLHHSETKTFYKIIDY